MSNDNLIVERTPENIATEINNIKDHAKIILINSSIEIGKRLVEAKDIVPHGEWGKWLQEKVSYSQRTADNLMKIYNEYGSSNSLVSNEDSQAIAKLNYTQAVLLLGMSQEDRADFIKNSDIDNMTTRELKQAINDRDAARKEKQEIESKYNKVKQDIEQISDTNEKVKLDNRKYYEEAQSLRKTVNELNNKIQTLDKKTIAISKGATDEEIEKVKNDTQKEYDIKISALNIEKEAAENRIKELELKVNKQNNDGVVKYSVVFDEVVNNFNGLLDALNQIKQTGDNECYARYKNAFLGLLNKMHEAV